ncbi:hypothetical protein B1R06_03595 [Salmonella enterica]|uniref:Uncharacterized protein n=1 Tax=Salmonella diarizonae TaxID=59204 RepID=A0A5Y1Y8A4_SALDZ|nr:hypothetical protein [Salmonella enterica]ECC3915229.1 hypothetical protein [Salmonella enterica subsp. diarizonae]
MNRFWFNFNHNPPQRWRPFLMMLFKKLSHGRFSPDYQPGDLRRHAKNTCAQSKISYRIVNFPVGAACL